MNTEIVKVEFDGDTLECIRDGEQIGVVLRPICEHLGLDSEPQRKRLVRRSWASTSKMEAQVPGDGQRRAYFCMDLDTLLMWLATLNEQLVRAELRPKLVRYQQKCKQAISAVFRGHAPPPIDKAALRALIAEEMRVAMRTRPAPQPGDPALSEKLTPAEYAQERGVDRGTPIRWMVAAGMGKRETTEAGVSIRRKLTRGQWQELEARSPSRGRPYPRPAQQELPLALAQPKAQPKHDAAELAERALRLLTRNDLPAFAVAEILGIPVDVVAAVLGPMVEAGGLLAQARAGRLLYRTAPPAQEEQPGQHNELREQVRQFMEAQPEGERVFTQEVIRGLGLEASRSNETRVGHALRALGYERARTSDARGWRRYAYTKRQVN